MAGGDVTIDVRLAAVTTCCGGDAPLAGTLIAPPAGTLIAPPMRGVTSIPFTVSAEPAEPADAIGVTEPVESIGGTSQPGGLWFSGTSLNPCKVLGLLACSDAAPMLRVSVPCSSTKASTTTGELSPASDVAEASCRPDSNAASVDCVTWVFCKSLAFDARSDFVDGGGAPETGGVLNGSRRFCGVGRLVLDLVSMFDELAVDGDDRRVSVHLREERPLGTIPVRRSFCGDPDGERARLRAGEPRRPALGGDSASTAEDTESSV